MNVVEEKKEVILTLETIALLKVIQKQCVLTNEEPSKGAIYDCYGKCAPGCSGSCSGDCEYNCHGSCSGGRTFLLP